MQSTSFNIYLAPITYAVPGSQNRTNLDHSCCWWESPRDTPFRQNAKAIFGCTALNSITEDSARAKQGKRKPIGDRGQIVPLGLEQLSSRLEGKNCYWMKQELLLDEAELEAASAGQQIQAQSAMAVVTQSLHLRANPLRTEPHSQAHSVVGWLCVSTIGFKFVFFIHAQK